MKIFLLSCSIVFFLIQAIGFGFLYGMDGYIHSYSEKFQITTLNIDFKNEYLKLLEIFAKKPSCSSKTGDNLWTIQGPRAKYLDSIFQTLLISLPFQKIVEYFKHYGVIVNRKPQYDKLVIGCGNLPSYRKDICVYLIDDFIPFGEVYRNNHAHYGCDTMDPDFARNPTIVGEFGSADIAGLFFGHMYKEIFLEGISIVGLPYATAMIQKLLCDNGIVRESWEKNKVYSKKAYLLKCQTD